MTVTEVPAWIVTDAGPEHVQLPIPAAEFLAEHRAVPIGVGSWTLTPEQRAYGLGRWEATYGDQRAELPADEWISARQQRVY